MKFLKVSLVIALSILTVTSGLLAPGLVKGSDTTDVPLTAIAGAPATATFHDVVWTEDGMYALWVGNDAGTGRGCIYRYDPSISGAGAWQMLKIGLSNPTSEIIRSIVWDPYDGMFVAVGDQVNAPYEMYWYAVDSSCTNIWEYTSGALPTHSSGYDLIVDTYTSRLLCVGYLGPSVGAACWQFTPGLQSWSVIFTGGDDESTFRGVAVYPGDGDIYVVGSNYPSMCGLYYRYSSGIVTWIGPSPSYNYNDYAEVIFSDIAYNPLSIAMVLTAEYRTSGVAGVYYAFSGGPFGWFSGLVGMDPESVSNSVYKRIEYDSRSGNMFIVGYLDDVTDYGRIHVVWRDSNTGQLHLKQVSVDGAPLSGCNFQSVSIRPARIPMALVAGSAFKYSYTTADSSIQVDAVIPHVDYVDVYDAGTTTSHINGQVDVDTGGSTTYYDLTVRAWSNSGQSNLNMVTVYLWYDGGVENRTVPSWGGLGFVSPGYENVRARFSWFRGTPDTWSQVYPSPGPSDEFTLYSAGCSRIDDGDGMNVTLKFRFIPHQQARASPGPFGEPSGTRYGGGVPEGQTTNSALDMPNTWNIAAYVYDVGGSWTSAYDEFGFFKYTYMGSGGLPGGGLVQGSGAPTTVTILSPSNQDIVYSANSAYQLSASITNLLGQSHGGTILATTFQVTGGNLGITGITGAGVPVYFYGSSVPTYQNPLSTGRTTTTSSGDFNADNDFVAWRCTIPSVLEDRYRGTITYSIGHG